MPHCDNANCLHGMRCPKCGSTEPFSIVITAVGKVYDDGVDEFSSVDWDDEAACSCACGFKSRVKAFQKRNDDWI